MKKSVQFQVDPNQSIKLTLNLNESILIQYKLLLLINQLKFNWIINISWIWIQ